MQHSHSMKLSRDPLAWIEAGLADLDTRDLRRELATRSGPQGPTLESDGGVLVNFGSNDYLGLASDPRLAAAAANAALVAGAGAGASPLVTGRAEPHAELERELASLKGAEAALVFSSGYAANIGLLTALAGRGDTIYSDQKNHASIIDGCRLSRASVQVYPHRDVRSLAQRLEAPCGRGRRLIVTESLFSMDGDLAPLVDLAELAERFGCMLVIDEAHATGVFGERGRGLSEVLGIEDAITACVGTLSKALGSAGGFVCGRKVLVDWLVNRARPYVFSTAAPPANCAAALQALEIVRQEPWRRSELLERAQSLRESLVRQGWQMGDSRGQIIPLLIGEPALALRLSSQLRERGLLVPAIRPPSVPDGESLLRISLSYAHTPAMIDQLASALDELSARFSARGQATANR